MSDSCTCSCATTRRRRRPTATLVIASLALFMSLGGTSYAAVKAKSIGSKQLKSHSVTSSKLARNAVTASAIRAGVIDGTKIRAGAIDSSKILDGTIGGQDIAANSIGPDQIADQSLGLGEINQATVNLFKDVPVTWIVDGAPDSAPTPTVSTDAFTTMRSYSVPAAGTGKTGTTLVQSQVSVFADGTSTVECYVYVAADPAGAGQQTAAGIKATSTSTVSGRVVVPVTALVHLSQGNVVQTRCRATGPVEVKADITNLTGATSMTLMRVAD